MNLETILLDAQELQRKSFGKRNIVVGVSPSYVNVCIFEKDYDSKEDGDCKNFTFYTDDIHNDAVREKEYKLMMRYYNEC